MSHNIIRLYYKENSKEPAVNEALVDLTQVSMVVRIGQQTVGLVVPGGWYEYALVSDNLSGLEKTTKSADKFIELTATWIKLHEVEPPKKLGRTTKTAEAAKAPETAPDFSKVPPPGDEWVEKLKDIKSTATLNGAVQHKTLTAMADKLISVGVPLATPPLAQRPPVMPPRQAPATHNFLESSGLPITVDLREVATMSPYMDGSRKIRMGLHRGGARVVILPVGEGETFETLYTALYYKWAAIDAN